MNAALDHLNEQGESLVDPDEEGSLYKGQEDVDELELWVNQGATVVVVDSHAHQNDKDNQLRDVDQIRLIGKVKPALLPHLDDLNAQEHDSREACDVEHQGVDFLRDLEGRDAHGQHEESQVNHKDDLLHLLRRSPLAIDDVDDARLAKEG